MLQYLPIEGKKSMRNLQSSNIKIEYCYNFFCCNSLTPLETIRKMYTYYLSYKTRYMYSIFEQECKGFIGWNEYEIRKSLERERLKLQTMIRLTHDSYLAILLYKTNWQIYENIIKGLYSYFEYSDKKINSPLEGKTYKAEEQIITKENYIKKLETNQYGSSNAGDYLFTSSLGSIIEIERASIDAKKKIKSLYLSQEIPYGDLQI